jgi:hypothetical protein
MTKKYTIAIFAIFFLILGLIPALSAEGELGSLPENAMVEHLKCSPNSDLIVIVSSGMTGNSIYKGNLSSLSTGTAYIKIADLAQGFVSDIKFSPDGLTLAYVLLTDSGECSVYKVGVDGSNNSLFYTAPSNVMLTISWIDNTSLLCSEEQDTGEFPVTKIMINSPGWSESIEPEGYMAAVSSSTGRFSYTRYADESRLPPDHAYVRNSVTSAGGPDNGDTIISANLTGDMRVYRKKWAAASLFYLVDDWNGIPDGEEGTTRLDKNGAILIPASLGPNEFAISNDGQNIAFNQHFPDGSESPRIVVTDGSGTQQKVYEGASGDMVNSPCWTYDNNYVLWVKNSMSGSGVMFDVAPNGTTDEPTPCDPVTVTEFQQNSPASGILVWVDPFPEDVTGYKVFWDNGDPGLLIEQFTQMGNVLTEASISVSGLVEGSEYRFYVIKIDGEGTESLQSNVFFFSNMPSTQAPSITNFQIESITSGVLEWDDPEPSQTLSHYEVYWDNANTSLSEDSFVSLGTTPNPVKTVSIENGNTYRFYVIRYDLDNNPSPPSDTYQANVYIQPNPVNINSFVKESNTQGVLSWSDSSVPLDLKEYRIYWDNGNSSLTYDNFSLISASTQSQLMVSGLVGNTTYRFFVIKVNTANITSNRSNVYGYTHTVQPDAVTITSIQILNSAEVQVNWDDNQTPQDLLKYEVYGDDGNAGWTAEQFKLKKSTTETQATISNLVNGKTYRFYVVKYSQASVASENSNIFEKTIEVAPQAVEITAFSYNSSTDGYLSWQDDEEPNDLKEYKVYWDNGDSGADPSTGFTLIKSGLTSTSALISFENGNTYRLFVIKVNSISLESPRSNIYQIEIAIKPKAVTVSDFTVLSGTSATLSWEENEGTGDLLKYEVWYDQGNSSLVAGQNFVLASVSYSQRQYTFTNLVNGSTYRFYVVKYNDGGFKSAISNIYTGVMNEPPVSVTGLSFEVIDPVSGTLSWTDPEPEDLLDYTVFSDEGDSSIAIGSFIEMTYSLDTTAIIDNLVNGTTYRFYVKKKNKANLISTSSVLTCEFKADPVPVLNLIGEIDPLKHFNMSWSDPYPDDLTEYYVYGDNGNSSLSTSSFYLLKTTTDTIVSLSGLVNGVTYRFFVVKKNLIGLLSDKSDVLTHQILIKPDPVSVHTFDTINYTSGTLRWSDSDTSDLLEYSVYWDNGNGSAAFPSEFVSLKTGVTINYTVVSNLVNNKSYRFYVIKINKSFLESNPSNVYQHTQNVAPNAVTNLTAEVVDYKTVKLTWDHMSQTGDTYSVYLGHNIYSEGQTAKSCTITGLENGTSYGFGVKAVNAANIDSDVVTVQKEIMIEPKPITSFSVTVLSDTSAKLSWSHVKATEDYYKISYKPTTEGSFTEITDITTKYYTITNLTTGLIYNFDVTPIKPTEVAGQSMATEKLIALPPNNPSNLSFTVNKDTDGIFENLKLSWSLPSSNNADGFSVCRLNTTTGGYYIIENITSSTTNEYFVSKTNLIAGSKYDYVIKAYRNFNGEKIYSEASNNVVIDLTEMPTTGVTVLSLESVQDSNGIYTGMKLNWSSPTGVYEKFIVYYWINDALNPMKVSTASTSYAFSNLNLNTKYNFRVDSLNTFGMPTESHNTLTVTTPKMPDPVSIFDYSVVKSNGFYDAIRLLWSANAITNPNDKINIYEGSSSTSIDYTNPIKTELLTKNYTNVSYTPSDTVFYAIRVTNVDGIEEKNTNRVIEIKLNKPSPVTGLNYDILKNSKDLYDGIKIYWSSSINADRYNIYLSTTGSFDYQTVRASTPSSTHEYTFKSLGSGTVYFVVRAISIDGVEEKNTNRLSVDIPETPVAVSFLNHEFYSSNLNVIRLSKLTVNWQAASSDSNIDHYNLYRNNGAGSPDYESPIQISPSKTSYTKETITQGLTYKFAVSVVNKDDVESDVSAEYSVEIPFEPKPVTYPTEFYTFNTNSAGTFENVSIQFNASESGDSVSKYNVYICEASNQLSFDAAALTLPSSTLSFTYNFEIGKSYFISIRTVDSNNIEDQSVITKTLSMPDYPAAPTGAEYQIIADANNDLDSVKLKWINLYTTDVAKVNVYWDNGTGTIVETPINTIEDVSTLEWIINKNIEFDKKYIFEIRNVSTYGIESQDNTSCEVIVSRPKPVTNLAYDVLRDDNGLFSGVSLKWDHSESANKQIYRLYRYLASEETITDVAVSNNTFEINDIAYDTNYFFKLIVIDNNGLKSDDSNSILVNIPELKAVTDVSYETVKDSNGFFDGIKITWVDTVNVNNKQYEIFWNSGVGVEANTLKETVAKDQRSCIIKIEPDVQYYFKIGVRDYNDILVKTAQSLSVIYSGLSGDLSIDKTFVFNNTIVFEGVTLQWSDILSNCETLVYWNDGINETPNSLYKIIPASGSNSCFIEITKNIDYKFQIMKKDNNGLTLKSEILSVNAKTPAPITNLKISYIDDKNLELSWDHSISADKNQYHIYHSVNDNTFNFNYAGRYIIDAKTETNIKYACTVNADDINNFCIRTINTDNIIEENENIVSFQINPAAVSDFKLEKINDTTIQLLWNHSVCPNKTLYKIFKSDDTSNFDYTNPITSLDATKETNNSFVVENIESDKIYYFLVMTVNNIDKSSLSDTVYCSLVNCLSKLTHF